MKGGLKKISMKTSNAGGARNKGRYKVDGSATDQKTMERGPIHPPPTPLHQRKKILALQEKDTIRV